MPSFGPVSDWNDLGIYGLLVHFPPQQLLANAIFAKLQALIENHPALAETLITYLDSGCNGLKTSRLLFIHRATLQHRLNKIEELTGKDLDSGEDRLALHLGLKLALLQRAGSVPNIANKLPAAV